MAVLRHYMIRVSAGTKHTGVRQPVLLACRLATGERRNSISAKLALGLKLRHCSSAASAGTCVGGKWNQSFSPDDGKSAFSGSSTPRLLMTWTLLELCRVRPLVSLGAATLSWAARPGSGMLGSILLQCARPAFAHFCAGERLQDCVEVANRLERGARVRCIVDWSVEEREDSDAWDHNISRKVETLQVASEALGSSAAFMPVKLTALLSPTLLERMTVQFASGTANTDSEEILCDPRERLGATDTELLEAGLERLRKLCRVARDCRVPILLDAEQTNRQPAVHMLARLLQQEFNVDGQIVIYDTLQMYLKSSLSRLDVSLEAAKAGGYTYAVKLVRGAYIEQEQSTGNVHPSKEATDVAYNAATNVLLSVLASDDRGSDQMQVAVILATHNRLSLERATMEMNKLGLARDHACVHFAQILGMVDNLTNSLGIAGYNASKLVVFGEIREVLPWLLRRVQENRDAFGAQAAELYVLRKELQRRLLGM